MAEGESGLGAVPLIVLAALFAGSLLAAVLKFRLPLWPLVIAAAALFFLSWVVTSLNPWVRTLILAGAGVLAGAAAATAAWLH